MDTSTLEVKEIGRVSHEEFRNKYCGKDAFFRMIWWSTENTSLDIQRIFESNDHIYSFSRFGIMINDLTFNPVRKIEYANTPKLCNNNYY